MVLAGLEDEAFPGFSVAPGPSGFPIFPGTVWDGEETPGPCEVVPVFPETVGFVVGAELVLLPAPGSDGFVVVVLFDVFCPKTANP